MALQAPVDQKARICAALLGPDGVRIRAQIGGIALVLLELPHYPV
jgi:hypothetical protein